MRYTFEHLSLSLHIRTQSQKETAGSLSRIPYQKIESSLISEKANARYGPMYLRISKCFIEILELKFFYSTSEMFLHLRCRLRTYILYDKIMRHNNI